MKAPKLLKIVNRYLSADKEKQYEHTKCFTDIITAPCTGMVDLAV